MSSKDAITRRPPVDAFWRPDWPTMEVPDGHALPSLYYHAALGIVAARFNSLEAYFRMLVGSTIGLQAKSFDVALTHVGSRTLGEMLAAASVDLISSESVRDELTFARLIFDNNTMNRNFLIHSARELHDLLRRKDDGILATKRTAHKRLKVEHYIIPIEVLRRTADQIHEAIGYFAQLVGPLRHHKDGTPLELPSRPLLPDILMNTHPKVDMSYLLQTATP